MDNNNIFAKILPTVSLFCIDIKESNTITDASVVVIIVSNKFKRTKFERHDVLGLTCVVQQQSQNDTTRSALLLILPRDAMLARYMLLLCVRPSVRHTPVLYQYGQT